jgi:Tfp pilus assembly protein PilO
MDNLTLLAIIISIFWLAGIGYYLYVSGRQDELSKEVEELKETLEETQEQSA